ncbi:FAD binding domain-containing protein [Deinococcus sp. SL84]|uniref:FAD binding domain-containing protein n=1 Tax=Deinococcus sp. SL84 TaxID=2994663 RepID=UPI0022753A7A|nr:xanthine dehydrogenase family protein subunit M [Deinococcus sp. SL84]MCY1704150.1 xanthine dehydrogenase family protein subunit M [Deinococcus sp. SL84]
MKAFEYVRAENAAQAPGLLAEGGKYLAGGTNLLDLMKLQIEAPAQLVDLNRSDLADITETEDGGLRIGALVRNTELAAHPRVRADYAVLSRAILAGASGQIRNRATTAGNLLQRTRCPYFYDTNLPCNKREPGSGCGALEGFSRSLAVIGTSEHCIANYPGDMAVALRVLDAAIQTVKADGSEREIPVAEFHRLPGDTPHIETVLEPGELITSVTLPAPLGGQHVYLKARDRQSYAFALVSVAAVVSPDGARLAFGGVAPKPWRVESAEARWSEGAQAVTDEAFRDARPTAQNAFKLDLARRLVQAVMNETGPNVAQTDEARTDEARTDKAQNTQKGGAA